LNPRVRNLAQALELSAAAVRDAATVADSVYKVQERTIFSSEGPGWKALSPRYRKWKSKKFPGRKILTLTGRMRDAFATASPDHFVFRYRVTKWRIQLGAQGPHWWKYHAEGGRIPGRPPVRNPQLRSEAMRRQLGEAVARGLVPHIMRDLRLRIGAVRVA